MACNYPLMPQHVIQEIVVFMIDLQNEARRIETGQIT